MKKILRAASVVLLSGGIGVIGSGLASGTACAEPIPAPIVKPTGGSPSSCRPWWRHT